MIPVSALAVDLGAVPTADMRKFLECAVQNHLYDEITQCKTLSIKYVDIVAQSTGRREAAPPLTLLSENSYSECTKKAEQDAKIVIERAAAKRGREELNPPQTTSRQTRRCTRFNRCNFHGVGTVWLRTSATTAGASATTAASSAAIAAAVGYEGT